MNTYQTGQTIFESGCFTLEGYIIGQNLSEIAYRLGFPQWQFSEGVYIIYALRVPGVTEFELAGVTYDSTDKFVSYNTGQPRYEANKFQQLYTQNAVTPVDFEAIKRHYHSSFGINKLVKVKTVLSNHGYYPTGGMTPQFLIPSRLPLPCYVAAFIPPNGNFII